MNGLIDQIPGHSIWNRQSGEILQRCNGAGGHVPYPATEEGLRCMAREMEGQAFPRAELSGILLAAAAEIDAPEPVLRNCRRLAEPGALVVVGGQQPMPGGGPLMVFYKAIAIVALARRAEAVLGRPVVPIFWNASEDHDLDEMRRAAAPGGGEKPDWFRADLSAWQGQSITEVEADTVWQKPLEKWLDQISPGAVHADFFKPLASDGWALSFSRILTRILGSSGLIVLEPRHLYPLAGDLYGRVIEGWAEVERLLAQAQDDIPEREGKFAFPALGGPPLFLLQDGRQRIVARSGGFFLRNGQALPPPAELAAWARREPESFSAHASLRPLVQNSILPSVAVVLGPGELAYHEELYYFHQAQIGAGRRLPVIFPRLSATIADHRITAAMKRFGVEPAAIFLTRDELIEQFIPGGGLTGELEAASSQLQGELQRLSALAMQMETTLEKPFRKNEEKIMRLLENLARKTSEAEARFRGFAPGKLHHLAAWVRPGGRFQERVFCLAAFPALCGGEVVERLLAGFDPCSFGHYLIRLETRG